VAWKNLCLPKKRGGLGIEKFALGNIEAVANEMWYMADGKDCLWMRYIQGIILKGRDFWEAHPNNRVLEETLESQKQICTSLQ